LPLVRYSGNKLVSLWLTASDKSFKQTNTIAAVQTVVNKSIKVQTYINHS
jgi:hypothetical protein